MRVGLEIEMAANHLTEAACLVEQGAQYNSRIGLRPFAGDLDPIFAGFKAGAFSLFFGDSPFYHFDLDGRWQRAVIDGTHFLKGLDGRVQVVRRVREERNLVLRRHILTEADASDFDLRIRSAVLDLIARLHAERLERVEPPAPKATALPQDELHDFLERILRWDADAWEVDRQRYLAAYRSGPLTFLPPECQNAVVLQATLGHAGGVAFGGSAPGVPYVRPLVEFQDHATRVAALWGRRLCQSRFVFLAGSDLLRQPVPNVVAYLDAINRILPMAPACQSSARARPSVGDRDPSLSGVQAFQDNFLAPRPDRQGWIELAQRGLVRVSLGVESGDLQIRALYQKTYSDDDLRATVRDVKSAGMGVSLLTLVGAGGNERAAAHVLQTTRLVESLELGPGDFVFLLDETEIGDPCHAIDDITPLDRRSWVAEQVRLKEGLAPLKNRDVKVLPYTLAKQPL
jgi:hypothetical protein